MRELLRTNDPVEISFIEYLLGQARIHYMVLDTNMSVLDGSIGALPRRILVTDDGWDMARKTLSDANIILDE